MLSFAFFDRRAHSHETFARQRGAAMPKLMVRLITVAAATGMTMAVVTPARAAVHDQTPSRELATTDTHTDTTFQEVCGFAKVKDYIVNADGEVIVSIQEKIKYCSNYSELTSVSFSKKIFVASWATKWRWGGWDAKSHVFDASGASLSDEADFLYRGAEFFDDAFLNASVSGSGTDPSAFGYWD